VLGPRRQRRISRERKEDQLLLLLPLQQLLLLLLLLMLVLLLDRRLTLLVGPKAAEAQGRLRRATSPTASISYRVVCAYVYLRVCGSERRRRPLLAR
jgi:hypothetical protein